MTDILCLSSEELRDLARERVGKGAGVFDGLYRRAFLSYGFEPEAAGLSGRAAASWRESFKAGSLSLERVVEEEAPEGGARKALLRADDGAGVECVLIPMAGGDGTKATLCISSQVGCRMACVFCRTGAMGFVRDLSAAEIVSQAALARGLLGWDFGNVVFMGMGEPLDNLDAVAKAIEVLGDRRGFGLSKERVTLCTSGLPEGIRALRERGWPRLNLSISLNAGDDATRSSIMPVNRRWPLAELAAALRAYPLRDNFVLCLNYCLIPGVNDSPLQAEGVAAFRRSVGRAIVNLIPYNPGDDPIAPAPTELQIASFEYELRSRGLEVRRRTAKGPSIMAACGQLATTRPE